MDKKLLLTFAAAVTLCPTLSAQRTTDVLDRGLVAMKTDAGVFCSWRIVADEWHNTKYNIYRGSTRLNSIPLEASNFTDPSGSLSDTYTVRAVVDGVEAEASAPVKVWEKNYTVITPKHPSEISTALVPNDATVADVDGDGQLEIIMKYDNTASDFHNGDNGIFTVIECLEMDGTVKWWINAGPNMGDFQNNEINIIAYDWDLDGKAEVLFRAADGTEIHMADGSTYTVGDPSINYRGNDWPSGQWFMHWGKEYLIYADGLTGKPYECIDYPLKRVEDANNPNGLLSGGAYDTLVNNEWGDGYGHRSSKYFFAAPYLDGRKPSIFLARGIYTKHKMITYDVDPATHKLVERWRWNDLGGAWHGQGYHNMGIADVDWDGRDEIVYGSMVIDDNGFGLSTTGLGHGDAQHCGDFDPYTWGQEIFACNEDNPNNNYRDATTSKIYYRTIGGSDDGRANMGNFIDKYPGAEGLSSKDGNLIGGASHKAITGDNKGSVSGITQNFRVYWDGDLCDESFDYSNGKNSAGAIFKPYVGRIALLEGSKTNNDTKGTPCFQGDILGDWREEYIMRDGDNNIRIYSTDIPTGHRIYSLWYDHQYRNAMVWQMCGYNQPPHVSFYLSSFEDITVPPAPLTMTDRTEVANNGSITSALDGKNVIICETGDMTITAAEGVAPATLTVVTPTWVQGHNDNNNITSESFTHTITSGSFGGRMKLIKQGDGKLILPTGTHKHTGRTEVWGGTLAVDGSLTSSPLWLNRHTTLETSDLQVPKGLELKYGSTLRLGTDTKAGKLNTSTLNLGFGSIVEIDLFADMTADYIAATRLSIETKDWTNGPEYLKPVIRIIAHPAEGETLLPQGRYLIGEAATILGDIDNLILLGLEDMKKELLYENGKLYLNVVAYQPGNKTWVGDGYTLWDLDNSKNFSSENAAQDVFVPGDAVLFDDSAKSSDVVITGRLMPSSVTFDNSTLDYTLSGDGQIVGDAKLVKNGTGTLTVSNINSYTGGTYINGGKLVAGVFANNVGTDLGALSDVSSRIYMSNDATLAVSATATLGQRITMQSGNAALEVPAGVELTTSSGIAAGGLGQSLIKRGQGTLNLAGGNTMSRLVIEDGVVNASEVSDVISLPSTVEFVKGSLYDPANIYTYSTNPTNYYVGEGNSGSLYLDSRCSYTGKLTGKGKLTVYAAGPRCDLKGNWSDFEGELVAAYLQRGSYGPDFKWDNNHNMPKATLNISKDVTFNAQSRNITIANLKGSGIYNGTGTLTVGNDNDAIGFAGSFSSKPKVVKTGKCDWRMTKEVSEITSLVARDGTLSLTASKSPYNTTFLSAPLTLDGNSKLRGRGTVGDITLSGNAILEPGTYSDTNPDALRYGPIFSTGNVTVNNGATLSLYLRVAGKSNDRSYLDVKGTLKIDGNVKVEMNPDYNPAIGDEFVLWTAKTLSGTPAAIELPELPKELEWDTEGLKNATGVLKVAKSSGIGQITGDNTPVTCTVYNTFGVIIGQLETTRGNAAEAVRTELNPASGIYILKLRADNCAETLKLRF